MKAWYYDAPVVMTCDEAEPITSKVLATFIDWHRRELARYDMLKNMYKAIIRL